MLLTNFFNDNVDWERINKDFQDTDWHKLLTPLDSDPDTQYKVFIDKCINIISSNNVPPKIFTNKKKSIPRDRQILMKKRKKLRKRFTSRKSAEKRVEIEVLLQKSFTRARDNKPHADWTYLLMKV